MNRQRIKDRAREKRAREVAKKRMILLLATVLLITIGSIIFGNSFSSAQAQSEENDISYKYYKSIVIEAGDSLWSIAEEYRTDDYASTQEYIDELMEINGLDSETIHQGQHLVVAYYDQEFK